jgi:hypothetical protein
MSDSYHRHALAWVPLSDMCAVREGDGSLTFAQPPYAYCPICKCIPKDLVAKTESGDANAND